MSHPSAKILSPACGWLLVLIIGVLTLAGSSARAASPESAPLVAEKPEVDETALSDAKQLDAAVQSVWRQIGLHPAPACSDAVFIRRVYLDVIGTLPRAEDVRTFVEDKSPGKRAILIDQLLQRDEFADYWAMKWCNLLRVKSEFPINLWPNAVQAYHHWIRTSIKENVPYDRFVRELLTASGSNIRQPTVNFYRAVQSKDPQTLAQAVALTFMGVRTDKWPKERLTNMAAFFSRVGYKTTAEWKEEIVFFDLATTNAPASAVFPDGMTVKLPALRDPRDVFADWLVSPTNAWFTRNIANRSWAWFLGRGIINEPDDLREDNPPVNRELLKTLERQLVASHYDLKKLFRSILNSQAYQLSSTPTAPTPQAEANFGYYPARRLEAEVLIDAINQITGTTEKYTSRIPEPFTFIPEEKPAIALADSSITSPFLDLFGRSPRDTGLESETVGNTPSAAQQLHLLNSSHIRRKLEQSAQVRTLSEPAGRPRVVASKLYLTILSRYPTAQELDTFANYSQSADNQRRAGMDLAWALINSAEFQFRH